MKLTLGVIIGNRDFFPDVLIGEARRDLLKLFGELQIEAVLLDEEATKLGAVETWEHAKRCAELFRAHSDKISGVVVCLPNFGDEKGVADTLKLAGLNVPVLVQAYPDDLEQLSVQRRRDAFCGKISVCNNLRQYDIPFSITEDHTVHPLSPEFRRDLANFAAQCRVVAGLRKARIGAVGARPNAFNTTRYSEKLLQSAGISVSTMDLSDLFGRAARLSDDHRGVKDKMNEICGYASASQVPGSALTKMAKLAVVLLEWMDANDLNASAIQCWSSMQENFGVNVCTVMSMMSERLMPSACEVDITGVVGMYALQLASVSPSALVDWNNNYGGDRNKCVFFHCGNWASSFLPDAAIGTAPILGTTLGEQNTYGALAGRTPAGPVTFARVSTDDRRGSIRAYVGEGQFTDDPLSTFGSRAVVEVPNLPQLMRYICRNGFEHHAAMNASSCAGVVADALETYMGWQVYCHNMDRDTLQPS
jgi:L-fucose isomerase-like protein